MVHRLRSTALLLAPLLIPASCGSGTVAIVALLRRASDSTRGSVSVIADVQVETPAKRSPAKFSFRLIDSRSQPRSVEVDVVLPDGSAAPALLVGAPGLSNLAASPNGALHGFDWDFASQLATGSAFTPGMRLRVRGSGASDGVFTAPFDVGNDPPTISIVGVPAGEVSGPVPVDLVVGDSSSDLVDVVVEYCDLADPTLWRPATPSGATLQQVVTTPAGVAIRFLWDAEHDEPQREFPARLRFAPTDAFDAGVAVETPDLRIDNNTAPTLIVDGSGFVSDGDSRRGIPLRYTLVDEEGDALRVVFQWAHDSTSFPALPDDPAALDAILANPSARQQHHVATEMAIARTGQLVPTGGATARLPELGSSSATLVSEFVTGRILDVHPVPSPPIARAASWSTNPLVAPTALLPAVPGPDAFALDRPSAGTWRLRELDLATGDVVCDVATGADGDPSALAYAEGGDSVLIAADAAGAWTLLEIRLADGARTAFFTNGGTVPSGTVRGITATGPDTVLVTVADALVAIDRLPSAPAVARVLMAGLAGPWGVAVDARNASRIYLAESTWVDPSTSTVKGRVSTIDLTTMIRVDLVSTGIPLLLPEAIALERGSARLLVVTDAVAADGTRELRAVDLGDGRGGPAFEIVSGLPIDVNGLATGPDDARLLAFPSANDVAASGGVQQVRTITDYDAATCTVTADAPFAPPLDARQRWRIHDASSPIPDGAGVRRDTFVWDSSDLPSGGEVVLRGTAYDTEAGLATDTSVPRAVRAGIDVVPVLIGGSATTTNPTGIAAADLDGDGDVDLVSANSGADSATIFFQGANHVFPVAPSVTLTGIPLLARMTQPGAVIAADLDGDGRIDVATANHGSNNLTFAKQGMPGAFTVQPTSLGGVTGPTDLVAADLNGDGRIDLACSNDGSNNVAIYLQSILGTFPTSPSALLSSANTLGASGIDAGDVDRDGDIDLVASFRSTNKVGIFQQSGGGNFPAAPSQLLGGAGLTDGPECVRLADVDRDGRLDLVVANRSGNCVSVFLQPASGTFPTTPTLTLASPGGPIQPLHVAAGDVNGDGGVDLVATSATDSLVVFLRDPASGTYSTEALIVHGAGGVIGPAATAIDDFDGDGRIDLATANQGGSNLALFYQRGGGSFAGQLPDLVVGSALETPDVHAVAIADVDGDGDLDLAAVDSGDGTIALFRQFAPAVFSSHASARLGGDAASAGATAIAAADVDGDGRVDLVAANRTAKTLTVYRQRGDGTFPTLPDQVLGAGALAAPASVALADLDGDGDVDVACADPGASRIALFLLRADGTYPTSPDALLGSNPTTNGAAMVLAADLNGDGAIDLAAANTTGNNVAVFFQQAGGTFHALPDATLGGGGTTNGPVVVAAADVDGNGSVDLACANQGGNSVALFLAGVPGSFPTTPSLVLTHASLTGPTSLDLADVDGDGSCDVASAGSTSDKIVLFFQGNPGAFPAAVVIGSAAYTSSPLSLTVVDLDGDGDQDLVSAQPDLDNVPIFFGAH